MIQINGYRGLFNGGGALVGREIIYVVSYKIMAENISKLYAKTFEKSRLTDVLGAGTSGAIGGAVTTPLDCLRAVKQDQSLVRTPESYIKILNNCGYNGVLRGVAERSIAIALACIFMDQGSKILYQE